MDVKGLTEKVKTAVFKFKYAAVLLLVGLALLLLPKKSTQPTEVLSNPVQASKVIDAEALEQILQSVQGAGKVQVLLSTASGEEIIYQTNTDTSTTADTSSTKIETVIITDSGRSEAGLVAQVNPPAYQGAIVVCQGADSAAVKFAVTQAVSKITGLGTDRICVLKMK